MTNSASSPPTTATDFLNNRTQDFEFQAFEVPNYEGRATDIFQAQGHFALEFNASSYVWQPNGTRCCVTFCQRAAWVGWWCQPRYQPRSSGAFDTVYIGCSGEESEASSRKSCEG